MTLDLRRKMHLSPQVFSVQLDPDGSQDLLNTKKMRVIPAKAGTSLCLLYQFC